MKSVVTSYPDPDLDGIASSVVLADYLRKVRGEVVTPVYMGRVDSETALVLERLGISPPLRVPDCLTAESVYLVDTHDPDQLQGLVPLHRVVMAIDHHPSGPVDAFPRATIQNETVGAAATLVAERYRHEDLTLDEDLAALLFAAIASNTMGLEAPSTDSRDREGAEWLSSLAVIPPDLLPGMAAARSRALRDETPVVLRMDFKPFRFGPVLFGMSQIEGHDATTLAGRPDMVSSLTRLREEREVDHVLANLVDQERGESCIVTDQAGTAGLLSQALGIRFEGLAARVPRAMLRKSDIVPSLTALLSGQSRQ